MLTLSNLSMSRPCVALDDTFTVSYTLKNTGSGKITDLTSYLYLRKKDFDGTSTNGYGSAVDMSPVSLAKGASRTFTYTITPKDAFKDKFNEWMAENPGVRAVPLRLHFNYQDATSDMSNPYREFEIATLLDMHYELSIDAFQLLRATDGKEDDEGENVLATIDVSAASGAVLSLMERTTLRLYYAQNAAATESSSYIDFTSQIMSLLAGETNSANLITRTFDKDSDWGFMLVFSDGYEPYSAPFTLAQAFANVHLSGKSTGGVAFGKFSSAEEGKPLFECEYPAEFNGGIKGVTNYVSQETPTGGTWIDGKPIYRQVIPFTISSANEDTAQTVGTIADMGTPISMQGFAYRGAANTKYMPLNFWYTDTNYCSTHLSDAGAIIMKLSHASTGYIILEYTKSA